jgi:hypothetical protein
MNIMIRSIHPTLRTAVVFCALALILSVTPAVAFDSQESGGEQQRRGQTVGVFIDAAGIAHGFVAECDAKKTSRGGVESFSSYGRTCAADGKAQ